MITPTAIKAESHDLDRIRKFRRYHRSPLYQVAEAMKNIEMESLEIINPFTLAPWEARVQTDDEPISEGSTVPGGSMQIAFSSSSRNELVGFGVAIEKQPPRYRKVRLKVFSVTLGEDRAKSICRGASGNGAYTEVVRGIERLQD